MSGDYYRELMGARDEARAVGWEGADAATARYEAVAGLLRQGDAVLDLGAGLGGLGRHLRASGREVRYRGVEREPAFVRRAAAMAPPVDLVAGDFMSVPLTPADVVVAIGALVDGQALRSDGARFGRLRELIARATSLALREAVLVVLDQDALEAHPVRSLEPALGGLRLAEIPWLCPDASVTRLLELDLVVRLPGRAGVEAP